MYITELFLSSFPMDTKTLVYMRRESRHGECVYETHKKVLKSNQNSKQSDIRNLEYEDPCAV